MHTTRWAQTLGLGIALLALFQPVAQPREEGCFVQWELPEPCSLENGVAEKSFRDYTIRVFNNEAFVIFKGQRLVYAGLSRYREEYYSFLNDPDAPVGKDLTGDGVPDVVIVYHSGGNHCCWSLLFFELGEKFRPLFVLDDGVVGSDFEDLDGDGLPERIISDPAFELWSDVGDFFYPYCCSLPAPRVVLHFQGGEYRFAPQLMRQPPPSAAELEEWVQRAQDDIWWEWNRPSEIFQLTFHLIYSGHLQLAWSFFDRAWKPEVEGKTSVLETLRHHLRRSPYWLEIKLLNHLP